MAGPRAPSGSLRDHASSASKVRSSKGALFSSAKPTAPKVNSKTFIGDESDSDSSSSSDSDSDSDSDIKNEPVADLQKRLSQTPSSKTKTNSIKADVDSKFTTPAKSPTVNGLAASMKKEAAEKKIKKEDTTSESSDDDSDSDESEPSSDEEDKKEQKVSSKSTPIKKSESESDSDTSSSSESESESEDDREKKPQAKPLQKTVPKGKVPVKKDDTTSSSESESESTKSESESEKDDSEDASQQIEEQIRNDVKSVKSSGRSKAPVKEPSKKKAKRSESPVSENKDEDGDVEMMDQSTSLAHARNPTKVGSIPEFVAPDFHLRKLEGSANASEIATFFSKAQMEGKQVWYITAPASLPVTVVQDLTIPIDQAQKGLPVLTHNGDDYRMAFDNPAASSSFRLLIPNKKGDEYSLLNGPVNQTMHFTRSETFPPGGPASVTTTQTVSTTKPARPQPEGLRTRYTPLGVPSQKPTIMEPVSSKNKATAAAVTDTPGKSSKKKRKHRDDGENGPATTITPARKEPSSGEKNITAEKSTKKQKTSNQTDRVGTPRRETPVPLPPQINGGYRSSSNPPATQPAPRSRSSMSPGVSLPATRIPAKQTPVPLPPMLLPHVIGLNSSSHSSSEKKKEQGRLANQKEKASKTPKVTQVLPPQFDKMGRLIS